MPPLPIHGFVLAGGRSSRMGTDKALLPFANQPMIQIAVEKLSTFCAAVSIAGNREDLATYAPIVHETRMNTGPAAGIEAGLNACTQPWALFIPVDVPLVPPELLRLWCEEALRVGMSISYLGILGKQPAFCLLQRERVSSFSRLLDSGERELEALLNRTAAADTYASWMYDEYELYGGRNYHGPSEQALTRWFTNINTAQDLAEALEPESPSSPP